MTSYTPLSSYLQDEAGCGRSGGRRGRVAIHEGRRIVFDPELVAQKLQRSNPSLPRPQVSALLLQVSLEPRHTADRRTYHEASSAAGKRSYPVRGHWPCRHEAFSPLVRQYIPRFNQSRTIRLPAARRRTSQAPRRFPRSPTISDPSRATAR